ncbi:hypothetical protein KGA66_03460 [Actinocrinis puniceicyclus]|uniref:Secreted protein n=1 Tax=Actinocrinis puniceicyclus TaxID=977794 RepID=A0A8J8BBH8_9ACTN|nr:hypothetical protein [Actinocrinis puniceicyclus]MBS2962091.1 hypothetical protein [Actinocrinis puniceicyclus]
MDLATQLVTIVGVLVGALSTYVASYLVERGKDRRGLALRWDERKLDTYVSYVAHVRDVIYAAVLLFESREGLRTIDKTIDQLTLGLIDAERSRALLFEQLVLLGGAEVVDAGHELNRAVLAIDWRARELTDEDLPGWRALHVRAFQLINEFHNAARSDLGVRGELAADHSGLTLNLPSARQDS